MRNIGFLFSFTALFAVQSELFALKDASKENATASAASVDRNQGRVVDATAFGIGARTYF